MLVGVATGRSGNLRGLDHMTNMCHYMKMNVYPLKLPLSSIHIELTEAGFTNPKLLGEIRNQIKGFIQY